MMLSNEKNTIKPISKIILPAFHNLFAEWQKGDYIRYIAKGGRGSAKSTTIATILILELMRNPLNIVVFRKVGLTLRKSVFEQLKWAIRYLELEEEFEYTVSPMQIKYKERGNQIFFLGVDDPTKTKSIVDSEFPIARFWFEELAEFKTEDEVETVINSVVRGKLPDGLKYKGFFSYNPPKARHNWVNKKYEIVGGEGNSYVHHSIYTDNPHNSKEFLLGAEVLKKRDEKEYQYVYLGKVIGSGIVPFPNLVIGPIPDSVIKGLDTFRNGVDWGYSVDPLAFVRWGANLGRKKIYAVNEFFGVQKSNTELARHIKKVVPRNELVKTDNTEPKSNAELKTYGIRAKSAKKGKGSVETGEKWLGEMTIYIDPKRTPNIAREFQVADYDTDRYGEPIPRLKDKDNHTIDASRYAFEDDMKKRRKNTERKNIRPKGI